VVHILPLKSIFEFASSYLINVSDFSDLQLPTNSSIERDGKIFNAQTFSGIPSTEVGQRRCGGRGQVEERESRRDRRAEDALKEEKEVQAARQVWTGQGSER